MRRYLQGTLDYACAVYAVINALSCLHGLKLAEARHIFAETQLSLAARPVLWRRFTRNETDHYWLVRHMLRRWCAEGARPLRMSMPLGALPPADADLDLDAAPLFLPENHDPSGPTLLRDAREEAAELWNVLASWFAPARPGSRAAVLRFHRFLPGLAEPIVSHWTTVRTMNGAAAHLHDASSENNALHSLERTALLPADAHRALLRIVPESLFLLEK